MPDLTRRSDPDRPDCWHIYFGDAHVGTIAKSNSIPNAEPRWQWLCGFYPDSEPGEQRGGTAPNFDQARDAFNAARRIFSASEPRLTIKPGATSPRLSSYQRIQFGVIFPRLMGAHIGG